MLANDQTKALELLESKTNRGARESVTLRKLTLRRKHVTGNALMLDLLAQYINKLIVQGLFARSKRHADTSFQKT